MEEWRAFNCEDFYDWRSLVIESMDGDTETRRLSPVAVYHPEGYIDLINGPQVGGSDYKWFRHLFYIRNIYVDSSFASCYIFCVINPHEAKIRLSRKQVFLA